MGDPGGDRHRIRAGVLALVGAALPSGVRVILLSIAVVDDLLAITLIAVLFTSDLSLLWLASGAAIGALYRLTFRLRADRAWLLWILALATWVCIRCERRPRHSRRDPARPPNASPGAPR